MKITIEGIGTFSIPDKVATYFQEIAEERIAAIDSLKAAEAEIETAHHYLDECLADNPDQGRAVSLVDRMVLLVSFLARDHEVAALERRAEAAEEAVGIMAAAMPGMEMNPNNPQAMAQQVVAEVARLREIVNDAMELHKRLTAQRDGYYDELKVTRDLLRAVPTPYQHEERQAWYAGISDYLETL